MCRNNQWILRNMSWVHGKPKIKKILLLFSHTHISFSVVAPTAFLHLVSLSLLTVLSLPSGPRKEWWVSKQKLERRRGEETQRHVNNQTKNHSWLPHTRMCSTRNIVLSFDTIHIFYAQAWLHLLYYTFNLSFIFTLNVNKDILIGDNYYNEIAN